MVFVLPPLAALFWLLMRADLTHRRLPNRWILCYALLFPVYAWLRDMGWAQFAVHALVGAATFLLLLLPFACGGFGGGDVKLATAVMLWAGALLGIGGWLADRCAVLLRRWREALSARRGVPYGVALVAGGAAALLSQGG